MFRGSLKSSHAGSMNTARSTLGSFSAASAMARGAEAVADQDNLPPRLFRGDGLEILLVRIPPARGDHVHLRALAGHRLLDVIELTEAQPADHDHQRRAGLWQPARPHSARRTSSSCGPPRMAERNLPNPCMRHLHLALPPGPSGAVIQPGRLVTHRAECLAASHGYSAI